MNSGASLQRKATSLAHSSSPQRIRQLFSVLAGALMGNGASALRRSSLGMAELRFAVLPLSASAEQLRPQRT
jgi:hypothetical protein